MMKVVILLHGDNQVLHTEAMHAAVAAIEENSPSSVAHARLHTGKPLHPYDEYDDVAPERVIELYL